MSGPETFIFGLAMWSVVGCLCTMAPSTRGTQVSLTRDDLWAFPLLGPGIALILIACYISDFEDWVKKGKFHAE